MKLPARPTQRINLAKPSVFLHPPAVSGGSVFAKSGNDEIIRLDAPEYRQVWNIPAAGFLPDEVLGSIVRLRSDRGSHFRALSRTGEVIWTLRDPAGAEGWWAVDDRLYSFDPGIVVADVATGDVIDRYDVPVIAIQPIGTCDDVFVLGTPLRVFETWFRNRRDLSAPERAFDLRSRTLIWERHLTEELRGRAQGVGRDDTVFQTYPGSAGRAILRIGQSLFGFAIRENRILWQRDVACGSLRPVMQNSRVHFWDYSTLDTPQGNNRLVCLDEMTGETVYDLSLTRYGGDFARMQFPWPLPGIDREHIAFSTRAGLLALFRLSDGELVWSYKHRAEIYQPTLWQHGVLATSADGNLLIFDVHD